MHDTATPERLGRAFRERDEARFALLDELGHSADASLDWCIGVNAWHAKDIERFNAEILQALLAGLAQITRITPAAHRVWAAVAGAAALRMNDYVMPAAADRLADQTMIVTVAVAGRCVEKIDPEIERTANGGD